MVLSRCSSFHNANGIDAETTNSLLTEVQVFDSTIFYNTSNGLRAVSAQITSWGGKRLTANVGSTAFTGTNTPQ